LRLIRLMASGVDAFLGVLLALLLSNSAVGAFFAERAVVMLRIGSPETIWKGPVPMILGILGTLVYTLPFSMLLILATEPLTGTSPGKAIFKLAIVPDEAARLSRKQLYWRAATKTVLFWGLILALLLGSWLAALCFTALGLAVLVSVFLPFRPIHEAVSHTRLVRAPHPAAQQRGNEQGQFS
jgi:hypothetical protein